jgi:hypothetical protein
MGTLIDAKETFLGVSLTTYRDTIRRWIDFGAVAPAAAKQKLGLSRQRAAVLINEADLAGFLTGDPEDPLTNAGRGFVSASSLRPLNRKKASQIIQKIVDNCTLVNGRDDLSFQVERIWLFGSYVANREVVNDLDMVIETKRIPARVTPEWDERVIQLACDMGGEKLVMRSLSPRASARLYVQTRLTIGPRKHPRLSLIDVDGLKQLACECQLIFDRSRGGPVDDPVLPKHPDATERSESVLEKLTLPVLKPVPETTLVRLDMAVSPEYWRGATIHELNSLPRIETRVKCAYPNWGKTLGDLDGRKRAIIAVLPEYSALEYAREQGWHGKRAGNPHPGVLIERSIEIEVAAARYRIALSKGCTDGHRLSIDAALSMAAKVLLVAGCDLEAISAKTVARRVVIELSAKGSTAKVVCKYVHAELTAYRRLGNACEISWLSPILADRISRHDFVLEIDTESSI